MKTLLIISVGIIATAGIAIGWLIQPQPVVSGQPRLQQPPSGPTDYVVAPGNSGACGADATYLDQALQYGDKRQNRGPYADGKFEDYWRYVLSIDQAVVNKAIADGFRVEVHHGNYIMLRHCP